MVPPRPRPLRRQVQANQAVNAAYAQTRPFFHPFLIQLQLNNAAPAAGKIFPAAGAFGFKPCCFRQKTTLFFKTFQNLTKSFKTYAVNTIRNLQVSDLPPLFSKPTPRTRIRGRGRRGRVPAVCRPSCTPQVCFARPPRRGALCAHREHRKCPRWLFVL